MIDNFTVKYLFLMGHCLTKVYRVLHIYNFTVKLSSYLTYAFRARLKVQVTKFKKYKSWHPKSR